MLNLLGTDRYAAEILKKDSSKNGIINDVDLNLILKVVANYLFFEIGDGDKSPQVEFIRTAAIAVVELFPKSVTLDSLIYQNESKHYEGTLYNKVRYLRRKKMKFEQPSTSSEVSVVAPVDTVKVEPDDVEIDLELAYLTAVTAESEASRILHSLKRTAAFRQKNMIEAYQFELFFLYPRFILEDFNFQFPSIDPSSLTSNWPLVGGSVEVLYARKGIKDPSIGKCKNFIQI